MSRVDSKGVAGLVLELLWDSPEATHREMRYAPVDLWGDILPPRLLEALAGKQVGETVELALTPAEAVPARNEGLVRRAPLHAFAGGMMAPKAGRFYPRRLLSGVAGVSPGSVEPFRCLELQGGDFTLDLNHPLSGLEPRLRVTVEQVDLPEEQLRGRSIDWLGQLCQGPGMQARAQARPTDFLNPEALAREDEEPDGVFYENPRLVGHLDSRASGHIAALHGSLIAPGARVLDLMSAYQSHLPPDLALEQVVGLGLNQQEMEANPVLDQVVVHDLNADPGLPFGEASFDAVVCTASVEYLTSPREVMHEAARVLKPGGVLAITFANRFFPPKVISLWRELHDFEKMGLVLDYFLECGKFNNLTTLSQQGWPRPSDDRHYGEYPFADPVYGVWGSLL